MELKLEEQYIKTIIQSISQNTINHIRSEQDLRSRMNNLRNW